MEKEGYRKYLKNVYGASLVPLHYFSQGTHICSYCTYKKEPISWEAFLSIIKEQEEQESYPCMIWPDKLFREIGYGIVWFDESAFCLIGPFCSERLPYSFIREYKKKKNLKNVEIPSFSMDRITSVVNLVAQAPRKEKTSLKNLISQKRSDSPDPVYRVEKYHLNRLDNDLTHHSSSIERQFGEYMQNGDADSIFRLLEEVENDTVGKMSDSAMKQSEYTAVSIIIMSTKHAIEGGMDQFLAYDLSDLYLQEISTCQTLAHYTDIMHDAIARFAKEVRLEKEQKNDNIYIQKCKEYIYSHLNKPIQVREIAESIGISPIYLSQIFSKSQGETIKSYLLRKRIELSQNMLRFSDYDISQIASYLGFNSQSHFTAVFKKYVGETPDIYRKKNQRL